MSRIDKNSSNHYLERGDVYLEYYSGRMTEIKSIQYTKDLKTIGVCQEIGNIP